MFYNYSLKISFFTFLIFLFLYQFSGNMIFYRLNQLILLIMFLIQTFNIMHTGRAKKHNYILISIFILTICYLFVQASRGETYYLGITYPFCFAGLSLYLSNEKVNFNLLSIIFYLILSYFFYLWLFLNISPQLWLIGSENRVSTFIIFWGVLLSALQYKYYRKVDIIPLIFIFIICIGSNGRSGIMSSGILLLGSIWLKNKKIFFATIITLFIVLSPYLELILSLYFNEFYLEGFDNNSRNWVLNTYINNMNFFDFFIGVDYQIIEKITTISLHNSFLSIHSTYGIGLFFILGMLLLNFIRSINHLSWILFTIVILLRSYTDSVLITNGLMFGSLLFFLSNEMFYLNKKLIK